MHIQHKIKTIAPHDLKVVLKLPRLLSSNEYLHVNSNLILDYTSNDYVAPMSWSKVIHTIINDNCNCIEITEYFPNGIKEVFNSTEDTYYGC